MPRAPAVYVPRTVSRPRSEPRFLVAAALTETGLALYNDAYLSRHGDISTLAMAMVSQRLAIRFTHIPAVARPAWRCRLPHEGRGGRMSVDRGRGGMDVMQIARVVRRPAGFVSYLDVFRAIGLISPCVRPLVSLLQSP